MIVNRGDLYCDFAFLNFCDIMKEVAGKGVLE